MYLPRKLGAGVFAWCGSPPASPRPICGRVGGVTPLPAFPPQLEQSAARKGRGTNPRNPKITWGRSCVYTPRGPSRKVGATAPVFPLGSPPWCKPVRPDPKSTSWTLPSDTLRCCTFLLVVDCQGPFAGASGVTDCQHRPSPVNVVHWCAFVPQVSSWLARDLRSGAKLGHMHPLGLCVLVPRLFLRPQAPGQQTSPITRTQDFSVVPPEGFAARVPSPSPRGGSGKCSGGSFSYENRRFGAGSRPIPGRPEAILQRKHYCAP
jgi:hypothetical protein